MGRWKPDALGRLQQAALDLYELRGFDATTVADIAARAGLTERTFYRHFADKREVLFDGSDALLALMRDGLDSVPATAAPLDQVTAALESAGKFFSDRTWSRRRQQVVGASPELRERELMKLTALADALAARLRERGVIEPAATLAAETGMAAFRVAFDDWARSDDHRSYNHALQHALAQLRALTTPGTPTASRRSR